MNDHHVFSKLAALLLTLIFASFAVAGCSNADLTNPGAADTALPAQSEIPPSATNTPAPTRLPTSTPTEELCPPDLEHEVSTFYDEDQNWFVAITSDGLFETDQYYWCWSEITDQGGCPCEIESDSRIVCRVARHSHMASYEVGQDILIDFGMGGLSDCRLFYETLTIPPK